MICKAARAACAKAGGKAEVIAKKVPTTNQKTGKLVARTTDQNTKA